MQRIQIEGIKKDPWFWKHYVPPVHREDEEVNLDDVCAVFDDIEVGCYFFRAMYDCLSCLIKKFSNECLESSVFCNVTIKSFILVYPVQCI